MSHILVVEDEAIIRNAVRRLLTRHNHEVTEADSVDAAKALDLTSYDMIISDRDCLVAMALTLLSSQVKCRFLS